MGKGISSDQSKISAISEALERLASQYRGDEPVYYARASELNATFYSPVDLTPYSDKQYESFESKVTNNSGARLHECLKYNDEPIHWTHAWSLTSNRKVYIPFDFAYANSPYFNDFTNFFHNGGAAGNCLEEAILQAILELVERDAVAVWWYNKLACPKIEYNFISETLKKQIEKQLSDEYDIWCLYLTQDINIPVIAAIGRHKANNSYIFGFGCHLDVVIACQRAITELFQIISIKEDNTSPFTFSDIEAGLYLEGVDNKPHEDINSFLDSDDIKDDIQYCLNEIKRLDLDVLVINNSRPDLKLKTVKVIVPGLCHIFPYLGLDRLYDLPVEQGIIKNRNSEDILNSVELLI